ncbi:MAG: hypothetical protein LBR41_02100 [Rickettsiales bacterium]|jgi:4-hydroxy-tetrahydrodipicolinate reductase|nr:hypothetical protein [Rickettsiales bacterium]
MSNIVIVGYGKMGQMIESAARTRGVNIAGIVDPVAKSDKFYVAETLQDARDMYRGDGHPLFHQTVAIDFTEPKNAMENIKFYCDNGIDCVIGTTGDWRVGDNLKKVRDMVEKAEINMVHAPNFDTGVQIFMQNVHDVAMKLDKVGGYKVKKMIEIHHLTKKDPSGTGTLICMDIVNNGFLGKTEFMVKREGDGQRAKPHQMVMEVVRRPDVPGTHIITFQSKAGHKIVMKHVAGDRTGFANGALDAAEFIAGNPFSGGQMIDYADLVAQRFTPVVQRELGIGAR